MIPRDSQLPPDEVDLDDAAQLLACQTRVLAKMSTNTTRQALLDEITRSLETVIPASNCSILLLDRAGALRHGSAPTLPRQYLAAIDGLFPGPRQGSCGTAAHLGRPVIVEDIVTDDRWDGYHDIAAAAGLRSCWSTPVLGRSGRVVGTFAVYHRFVHRPTPRQQQVVELLTYLVSAVLEHESIIGALTVSEERFRRAFEDNAKAMAVLDSRGAFSRVNTAMQVLVGDRLAPGTTTLCDVIAPDDVVGVAALLDEVRAGTLQQAQCEVQVTAGDSERPVSLTMSLVRAADGEAHQVSVNMFDLTERYAALRERQARIEAELAQRSAESASHAKSAFLAAVSHEMRTPLQAITGFAELLGTLELDRDRRAKALRHITAGATHLLELVDDTLDLARIEAGALALTMEPTRLDVVVSEVLEFLAPVAAQYGVSLSSTADAGTDLDSVATGSTAHVDPRRLRQVLINLVSNAIRYSAPDAAVHVAVGGRHAGTVPVTVTDNGPGIPADVRNKLFDPYVQGQGVVPADGMTPGTGGRGVGLGLMLARGLTEAMGGSLSIGDADSGTGTTATVVLRAAEAPDSSG